MKKRKFLVVIIALCSMLCICFSLTACDGLFGMQQTTADEYFIFTLMDDGTYNIQMNPDKKLPAKIVIPSAYKGKAVTSIDSIVLLLDINAFNVITSITIPDSVTYIDNSAFYGCSGLESITVKKGNTKYHSSGNCLIETATKTLIAGCKNSIIPTDGSVTTIGRGAFSGCSGLTSITIPDSVTTIGRGAFSGCSGLMRVTIGNGVTYIGESVVSNCSRLESITVENGNTKYHSSGNCIIQTAARTLISGCKNSVIPTDGSVTTIGDSAFKDCGELTSIVIPDSVTNIGWGAFSNCNSLTSITIPFVGNTINGTENTHFGYIFGSVYNNRVPASLKEVIITGGDKIDRSAFISCSGLTSITILDNVIRTIGIGAFRGCDGLTSVTIGNGVASIGNEAFISCSGLTSITIPDSVTSIGLGAFRYCFSLESITVSAGNSRYHSNGNCLIETATKELILGCKNSVIPTDGSVMTIGSSAFA